VRVFQRLNVSAYFKPNIIFGVEHMRKNYFTVLIITMTIFTTEVFASDECKLETTVTGTVDTVNVSQSIQVGTIHLQLSNANGEVVFEEDGGVIGRITSQNTSGGSTLDHNIIFTDGSRIETDGDVAQIVGVNDPACSFSVVETISNFWGTKKFKQSSGEITAIGTISFCDGANGNHFDLSGTVCLK